MAAKTAFKQQCPSCEAMVPIKDTNLIGRKIDCPKCKYRFVVEDPGTTEVEEVDEAPPAKGNKRTGDKTNGKAAPAKGKTRRRDEDYDDEDESPKLKSKSSDSQKKLYIGLGLAGAALVLLVVAVVVIMANNGTPDKATADTNTRPNPAKSRSNSDDSDDDDDTGKKPAATPVVSGADMTNLLPSDTQMVLNVVVPEFLRTPFGNTALSTPGAYRSSILRQHLGFSDKDVDRVLLARNFNDNWLWVLVRSNANHPFDRKAVESALHVGKPTGKNAMKGDYLIGQSNWFATSPLLQFGGVDPAGPPAPGSRPVYVKFIDDHTLVMADQAPMKSFLANGGKFDLKTQPPVPSSAKDDDDSDDSSSNKGGQPNSGRGGPPMMGGRGGPPMGGRGGPPMGGGKRPPMMQMPGGGMSMMGGGPPNMPNLQQAKVEQKVQTTSYLTIDPALKAVLDRVETDPDPKTDPYAATFAVDMSQGVGVVRPLLDMLDLQTPANIVGAALRVKGSTLTSQTMFDCPNEDSAKDFEKLLHDKIEAIFSKIASFTDNDVKGKFGEPKKPKTTPGTGKFMPGMPGGGMMGGPPGMPDMMRQMQQMQQQRMGGNRPPGFGGPGGGMFTKGGQQQKKEEDDKSIKIVFTISLEPPKTVGLQTDVPMDPAIAKFLTEILGVFWLDVKSETDMVDAGRHLDLLAGALKSYVDQHKEFPSGTWQRPVRPGLDLPYPPDERVSWMVGLLPFLGHPDVGNAVAETKSWHDAENHSVAMAVIPEFLDPANGTNGWRVRNRYFNGMGAGATHFVGIAGVGLDAAEAAFRKDPKHAGKLGIFSYDTPTKVDAVKDGLENTIAVIEVPADVRGPWLAGGGSTVRGVPEKHSVRPFVCTEYQGKKGTFAIMGDGTVRFIPATIKDEDFKALCTIAGKERLDPDRIAPKVEGIKVAELKAQRIADEDYVPTLEIAPAVVGQAVAKVTSWQHFTSQSGGFAADFPGKPVEQTLNVQSPQGSATAHVFVARQGNIQCQVTYTELPAVVTGQEPGFWEGFKSGLGKRSGVKIVSEKPITLGRYAGREFELTLGPVKLISRVYAVKNRIYALTASPTVMKSEDIKHFFGSFALSDGTRASN